MAIISRSRGSCELMIPRPAKIVVLGVSRDEKEQRLDLDMLVIDIGEVTRLGWDTPLGIMVNASPQINKLLRMSKRLNLVCVRRFVCEAIYVGIM
jgi:hypothetical protein